MSSPDSQETAVDRDHSPPSILWAHQMRRENTRLADQIDNLTALVASTVDAAVAGKKSVEQLHTTAKDLLDDNRSMRERLTTLERANIAVNLRIENLERDNERLHDVLDAMDRKWTSRIKEEIKVLQDTKKEVLTEVKELLELQQKATDSRIEEILDIVRAGREKRCQLFQNSPISSGPGIRHLSCVRKHKSPQALHEDGEILVPDSMPSSHSMSLSADRTSECLMGDAEIVHEAKQVLSTFQQNGRTLVDYLSFAEEARAQLPRCKQEGITVEMFLDGLTDENMKVIVEKRLDDKGWTWDVLRASCQEISIQQEKGSEKERKNIVIGVDNTPAELKQRLRDSKGTKIKRRKRRCISLVPTDDESDSMSWKHW